MAQAGFTQPASGAAAALPGTAEVIGFGAADAMAPGWPLDAAFADALVTGGGSSWADCACSGALGRTCGAATSCAGGTALGSGRNLGARFMNTNPAASPMASAVAATANTSPAPERFRGGSDSTCAKSSAMTALFGRDGLGASPRVETGPSLGTAT